MRHYINILYISLCMILEKQIKSFPGSNKKTATAALLPTRRDFYQNLNSITVNILFKFHGHIL